MEGVFDVSHANSFDGKHFSDKVNCDRTTKREGVGGYIREATKIPLEVAAYIELW